MKRNLLRSTAFFVVLLVSLCANAYDLTECGISYNILSKADKTVAVSAYSNEAETGIFIDITDDLRPADARGAVREKSLSSVLSQTYCVVIPRNVVIDNEVYCVTSISAMAFANKQYMRKVTIPSTVNSIGSNAFTGCIRLDSVICYGTLPPTANVDAFYGVNLNKCKLMVPFGCSSIYGKTSSWLLFNNSENTLPTCDVPTVQTINGRFLFQCNTSDTEYHYSVAHVSLNSINGHTTHAEFSIIPSYIIKVFATAEGYSPSEEIITIVSLNTSTELKGDITGDGQLSVADLAKIASIILNGDEE